MHRARALGACDLPGPTEREPVVGCFLLNAAHDVLPEDAVVVANAVAHARDAERRHRIEKAGGETSETAVAEPRVGFLLEHGIEVDAETLQCFGHFFADTEIDETVFGESPEQ